MVDDAYAIFNHPFRVVHYIVTPPSRNQTTGDYIPSSSTSEDITGSFDRNVGSLGRGAVRRDVHGSEGLVMDGDMKFYTTANMELEDRIRIYFDSAATESRALTYRVKGIAKDYSWLESLIPSAPGRREYYVVPEEVDR